jgi:plasmid stability protein
MASITIRNLDDAVKASLRIRAAQHGRSMEEEARIILRDALNEPLPGEQNLVELIRRRFAGLGDVDLAVPQRAAIRKPPEID